MCLFQADERILQYKWELLLPNQTPGESAYKVWKTKVETYSEHCRALAKRTLILMTFQWMLGKENLLPKEGSQIASFQTNFPYFLRTLDNSLPYILRRKIKKFVSRNKSQQTPPHWGCSWECQHGDCDHFQCKNWYTLSRNTHRIKLCVCPCSSRQDEQQGATGWGGNTDTWRNSIFQFSTYAFVCLFPICFPALGQKFLLCVPFVRTSG